LLTKEAGFPRGSRSAAKRSSVQLETPMLPTEPRCSSDSRASAHDSTVRLAAFRSEGYAERLASERGSAYESV